MPKKEYNSFYGGMSGDDYVALPTQYLYGENVDGNKKGYGIVLGPKVNKKITTNVPICDIGGELDNLNNNTTFIVGNNNIDTGEIYTFESVDNTPFKTITSADTDYYLTQKVISFASYFYIIGKRGNGTSISSSFDIHSADSTSFASITYDLLDTQGINANNLYVPPHIVSEGDLYIGASSKVIKIDAERTISSYTFSGLSSIAGITRHGTVLFVYGRTGEVIQWKGVNNNYEGSLKYDFYIDKIHQYGDYDIAITTDGDYYAVGGEKPVLLYKSTKTEYGDSFGTYEQKIDFSRLDIDFDGGGIASGLSNIYIVSSGKHLYKIGGFIPGLQDGIDNIVTKNHLFDDTDRIYALGYSIRGKKLYFSYKSGTSYGVDYIDLDSEQSTKDGYFITNIFRGVPNNKNQIEEFIHVTANTNGDKYIKFYIRISGGDWEEIASINNDTRSIDKDKISSYKGEFDDMQIKVELHNLNQDEFSPLLQSMAVKYKTIEM